MIPNMILVDQVEQNTIETTIIIFHNKEIIAIFYIKLLFYDQLWWNAKIDDTYLTWTSVPTDW